MFALAFAFLSLCVCVCVCVCVYACCYDLITRGVLAVTQKTRLFHLFTARMAGAFIAFRESVTAYYHAYNQSDYARFITLQNDSVKFVGMDARVDGQPVPVVNHQTKAGMYTIGPYDQVQMDQFRGRRIDMYTCPPTCTHTQRHSCAHAHSAVWSVVSAATCRRHCQSAR